MPLEGNRAQEANLTTWVELVGYQHEFVHTGVLRALLQDPNHHRAVASALVRKTVQSVEWVETEKRVSPAKGKVDLVAQVLVGKPRPRPYRIAVEVKVGSSCRRDQLVNSAATSRSDPET